MDGVPNLNVNLDVGKLTKPVTKLIEKLANVAGVIYEPTRARRMAKAQADVARIEAESQIEVSDIQKRAVARWIQEQGVYQHNLESIIAGAIEQLDEDATPDKIADDWILNFTDKARLISDDHAQAMWSRALAGEAETAGSISKRSLNLLAELSREEAKAFQDFNTFCWSFGTRIVPALYDLRPEGFFGDSGISLDLIFHFEHIGLLQSSLAGSFRIAIDGDEDENVTYHGIELKISPFAHGKKDFAIGAVMFTNAAQQLCNLVDSKPNFDYARQTLTHWFHQRYLSKEELDYNIALLDNIQLTGGKRTVT